MKDSDNKIRVGVGVMIFSKDRKKILLGKRKGSHGAGEYSFPSGHLEYGESFEKCAKREVMEKCGVEIKNLRFQLVVNVCRYHPRHDIYLGFIADLHDGVPRVMEPEKCESWGWYELNNLPMPMFHFCLLSLLNFFNGAYNHYDLDYCKDSLELEKDVRKWADAFCAIRAQQDQGVCI